MPIQAPPWTEFLSCPVCCHKFDPDLREPVSLGCGHTVCRGCLGELKRNQCPYDQTQMQISLDQLPVNTALLSLIVDVDSNSKSKKDDLTESDAPSSVPASDVSSYLSSTKCLKELASLLKPISNFTMNGSVLPALSRPMQRKLVTLINCQLVEDEGRARAVRAARSLGERTVMELILHHQNHHQLSANLWAAVRSRGCQFLGPAMQEEVLKLVLLALEDGSSLSRKVLVMFVVQRLEPHFPQASKTSIGHVVQLLYRASCFKVSKRDCDSSLMQLKEEFRTYESLRREHDAQIVQIATEAGLRIAPDQWSSLLYGDTTRKSHMQSIIDKLQSPQAFGQSVQELTIALQRTGDPGQLSTLRQDFELLANTDPSIEAPTPDFKTCGEVVRAVLGVVKGLVQFVVDHGHRKNFDHHHMHEAKYKTSLCRDYLHRGMCPRNHDCTFAHSEDELEKYRCKARKHGKPVHTNHHNSNATQASKQVENSLDHTTEYNSNYYSTQTPSLVSPHFKNANNTSLPVILGEMVQTHPAVMQFVPKSQQPAMPSTITSNPLLKPSNQQGQFSNFGFPLSNQRNLSQLGSLHSSEKTSDQPMFSGPPSFQDIFSPQYINQSSYLIPSRNEFANEIATKNEMKTVQNPLISSWTNHNKAWQVTSDSTEITVENPPTALVDNTVKSLSQLKNRKDKILSQLQNLVGEEEMNEVASKVEKGEVVSADSSNYFADYPSIYNIWTTGANLTNFTWKPSVSKVLEPTPNESYEEPQQYELLHCEVPTSVVPRCQHFGTPVQVSASSQLDPVTVPSVCKPLPAISPVQQVLYKPGAYSVGLVSYSPEMDYLNIVRHGIIDPEHLHVSPMDPHGIGQPGTATEPMNVDQEEDQKIIIAAKEGIDTLEGKLKEILLREELNQVVQQIWKKEKSEDQDNNQC